MIVALPPENATISEKLSGFSIRLCLISKLAPLPEITMVPSAPVISEPEIETESPADAVTTPFPAFKVEFRIMVVVAAATAVPAPLADEVKKIFEIQVANSLLKWHLRQKRRLQQLS